MNRQNKLVEKTASLFTEQFGVPATMVIQAPGRVNLIGEHTDYNDGFVLPCAIDYQTVVCATPRNDTAVHVLAVDFNSESDSFDISQPITQHPHKLWANYIRGTIKHLLQHLEKSGHSMTGANIAVSGNVPQGAGLSSSASLEIAIGQTFNALYKLGFSTQQLAQIAQQAENQFVGCNCGIMDQLICAEGEAGSALLLDCRSLQTRAVPIPENLSLLIINSNIKRGLVDSEYNLRRQQCERAASHFQVKALRDITTEIFDSRCHELDSLLAKRARHVITENARVLAAAEALATGDIVQLSQLMEQSHNSMRDDFEITHPAIDTIVNIVKLAIGSQGGVRMTGGGFGGCVIALVPNHLVDTVCNAVEEQYQPATGIKEDIYICRAEAGAAEIETVA
jgi:galactokinase